MIEVTDAHENYVVVTHGSSLERYARSVTIDPVVYSYFRQRAESATDITPFSVVVTEQNRGDFVLHYLTSEMTDLINRRGAHSDEEINAALKEAVK